MKKILNSQLTRDEFKEHYFLKEDMVDFCRENGLKISGNKKELEERIIHYLTTGEKINNSKNIKRTKKHSNISLDTTIGEDFICSQEVRKFFEEKIGSNFKFKVDFQKWLKNNPDKTFADAIIAYYDIQNYLKNNSTAIGNQFKYNTYIRDFFKHNPDKSFKDAVECWNYKKNLKCSCRYDDSDLEILKKNS